MFFCSPLCNFLIWSRMARMNCAISNCSLLLNGVWALPSASRVCVAHARISSALVIGFLSLVAMKNRAKKPNPFRAGWNCASSFPFLCLCSVLKKKPLREGTPAWHDPLRGKSLPEGRLSAHRRVDGGFLHAALPLPRRTV